MHVPGGQHFTSVVTIIYQRNYTCLCNSTGEVSKKLVPSFLWTSRHELFPTADFALYPFAVINHSHEYDHMLSLVSSSREFLKWCVWAGRGASGLVWGTPNTICNAYLFCVVIFFLSSLGTNINGATPDD